MKNKISCVLMAAGVSKRFGENKLKEDINGQTLIEHSLSIIPKEKFNKVIVVSGQEDILQNAEKMGFQSVLNNEPEKGLSHTIELGLSKCDDDNAVMFLVSDQPYLKKETVVRLVDEYMKKPEYIFALKSDTRRGNPCIFPKKFYNALYALSGDVGGSEVIRRSENELVLIKTDEIELIDIDTKNDLLKIK